MSETCVGEQLAQLRVKEAKWLLFLHSTCLLYTHGYTPLPSHASLVLSDSIFSRVYCSFVRNDLSCSDIVAEASYVVSPSSVEGLACSLQDWLSHSSLQNSLSHHSQRDSLSHSPFTEFNFMPAHNLLQPLGVVRRLLRVVPSLSMTTERSSHLVTSLLNTLFSYLSFLLSTLPLPPSLLSLLVIAFTDALLTLPSFHPTREQYRLLLRVLRVDPTTARRVFGVLAVIVVNDPSSLEYCIDGDVTRSEEDIEAFFASVCPECVQTPSQEEMDVEQLKEWIADCESEEELVRRMMWVFG